MATLIPSLSIPLDISCSNQLTQSLVMIIGAVTIINIHRDHVQRLDSQAVRKPKIFPFPFVPSTGKG